MTKSIEQLRRDAKVLRKAYEAGEIHAHQRILNYPPRTDGASLKHADYLHVIAKEQGFVSWPALKFAAEMLGMDKATKQQRLKVALYYGQFNVVEQLLVKDPYLADGDFGLCLGLYRKADISNMLSEAPHRATDFLGNLAPPLTMLARSKWIHQRPDLKDDMLRIAQLLIDN